MALDLLLIATTLAALSGLPGLFFPRNSGQGERIAAIAMCIAALAGIIGAVVGILADPAEGTVFPWPALGNSFVGLDALSGFFLLPIFLMGGLGSIYGLGYWPQERNLRNGRKLRLFWGLMVAGMALAILSTHAMAFLLGWEFMALSAFFLVSTEDHREETCRAGWLYLIATHVGTLTLFVLFAYWHWATGSYSFQPIVSGQLSFGIMNGLFFMVLLGFGLKAGVMPLHFWLPGAHANAPSHVSAMLSGVVLKMGIYGLLRMLALLPDLPGFWGSLVLVLGGISALAGIVFAIGQQDLKRMLAYSSVENIGIILIGLGLAMLGRSVHRPEWIVLGMAGCLLHVWNHSLFKSLLFFCAGAVVHSTHTRQMDRLGGLARSMPWTAALFLLGSVAVCGLPVLNGFISELFVYIGLLQSLQGAGNEGSVVAIVAPLLAMVGALALVCFVKAYGTVFLGHPRTGTAEHPHEAPLSMRGPMAVLAICCVVIGVAPMLVCPILDKVIACWQFSASDKVPALSSVAPLNAISLLSIVLIAGVGFLMAVFTRRGRLSRRAGTWDCGFARPTSRMQYTGSSFSQRLENMFQWILRPKVEAPQISGPFPQPAALESSIDDAVLDRVLIPGGHRIERWFGWFRRFQQGLTQHYLLYILLTVILLLCTLLPIDNLLARLGVQP